LRVAVVAQPRRLKKKAIEYISRIHLSFRGGARLSEKPNITEGLQKIRETATQYKDSLVAAFKDMEVDVKDWNFAVGKMDKQYNVEVSIKLAIKPKKIAET
jgi:hypothetical protein